MDFSEVVFYRLFLVVCDDEAFAAGENSGNLLQSGDFSFIGGVFGRNAV